MKTLVILAVLALSACAGLPVPSSAPPSSTPDTAPAAATPQALPDKMAISGTRGLLLANYIYQSLGTPVAAAIERGVIAGPLKANVQAVDRQVIAALKAGRATQDVALKAKHAAEALRLLDRLSAITGIPIPTL